MAGIRKRLQLGITYSCKWMGSRKINGAAKGRLYAIATQSTGQADQPGNLALSRIDQAAKL